MPSPSFFAIIGVVRLHPIRSVPHTRHTNGHFACVLKRPSNRAVSQLLQGFAVFSTILKWYLNGMLNDIIVVYDNECHITQTPIK